MPGSLYIRRHPAGMILAQMATGTTAGTISPNTTFASGITTSAFDIEAWYVNAGDAPWPSPVFAWELGLVWKTGYWTNSALLTITNASRSSIQTGNNVDWGTYLGQHFAYTCSPTTVDVGGWVTYRPYLILDTVSVYYGSLKQVRLLSAPQLVTDTPVVLSSSTATVGGSFTPGGYGGGSAISARFVVLKVGAVPSLASYDVKVDAVAGDGSPTNFSLTAEGLTTGATYGVRAGATNTGIGTGYGQTEWVTIESDADAGNIARMIGQDDTSIIRLSGQRVHEFNR